MVLFSAPEGTVALELLLMLLGDGETLVVGAFCAVATVMLPNSARVSAITSWLFIAGLRTRKWGSFIHLRQCVVCDDVPDCIGVFL